MEGGEELRFRALEGQERSEGGDLCTLRQRNVSTGTNMDLP